MRDDYARPTTSVITWLTCAMIAGFVLQHIFWKWLGVRAGAGFDHVLALTPAGIQTGFVWTLLSYSLLHSMGNFLHIVFNLLGLFFIGRELLALLGNRRFLWLYGSGVLIGGLVWLAVNWSSRNPLMGASAGICALFMMFTALNPNRPFTLLLFFVLPVTIKPKWALAIFGGFDLLGFLFNELGRGGQGGIAHSAHLGGYLAGWLFFRFVHQREWQQPDRAPTVELPAWMRRKPKATAAVGAYKVNVTPEPTPASATDLRAEVDRILDKINSHGFGALTAEEKRRLDEAKDLLNRR